MALVLLAPQLGPAASAPPAVSVDSIVMQMCIPARLLYIAAPCSAPSGWFALYHTINSSLSTLVSS
eukprot:5008841-Pleurochrysis_carterae.AAC.5